jgi:7-carboxy-7-deazaguanine synthase
MQPIRNKKVADNLLIHEIFLSIQGESTHMGKPCIFVRTTGCHLRCNYCDTAHAFFAGSEMSIEDILAKVREYGVPLVELTGGEPLLQAPSFLLLKRLCEEGFTVLLETSGAVSIDRVDRRVKVILDIKTPSSGQESKNVYRNLDVIWPGCEVKFVLGSFEDYDFAKEICASHGLYDRCTVLFSPVVDLINPALLAEKIIVDKLQVRFQLQLHRILWGESPGR